MAEFSKWFRYYTVHARIGESIPETLPAEQDTNGNWGRPIDGLQLSVRFTHHEYLQGELIPAEVIFRNLNSADRAEWSNGQSNGDYQFTVHYGTNILTYTPSTEILHDDPTSYPYLMKGYSENVTFINLKRLFDFNQLGRYSVQAQIRVPTLDGKDKTNVISSTSTFQIVDKLSPSEIAGRNAHAEQLNTLEQRINDLSRSNAIRSMSVQTNASTLK